MANETDTTALGSLIYAEMIQDRVREKLLVRKVIETFFERMDISSMPTLAGSFAVGDSVTFAATDEDATPSNQEWTATDVVATAAQAAAKIELSDLAKSAALPGTVEKIVASMVTGATAYTEGLMGDLFGLNSANSVGSTGVELTLAVLDSAIAEVEINAPGFSEMIVAILHPWQVANLRADIISTNAAALQREDISSLFGAAPGSSLTSSYKGHYGGVPIFTSPYCPAVNTAADYAGSVLVPNEAFGFVSNWDLRIELQRSTTTIGGLYVPNISLGVVEKDEAMYCDVISDHK